MHGISHPPSTFIVPSFLFEIYGHFLAGSGHTLVSHNGKRVPGSFGLKLLPPSETMTVVTPDWSGSVGDRAKYFQTFKDRFAGKLNNEANQTFALGPPPFHVTIIHRTWQSRRFTNLDNMILQFSKGLDMSTKVYYGNESFNETVKLFAGSKVVVGYHGAGLVNTLFCPPDAIVLEYTTFRNMNATRMWRSNEGIAKLHDPLRWLKHTIDIDRLSNLSALANTSDPDHFIKSLPYVEVTGSTLYNSIQRVKESLQRPLE
jgi:hypothetical protein